MSPAAKGPPAEQPMQGIEYTINVLKKPASGDKSAPKWEKNSIKADMQIALQQADKLLASGDYLKIEVRQKYFDKAKNRNVDMTLKMYDAPQKKSVNVLMFLVIAVVGAAAAFAGTYFFLKQTGAAP